MSKFTCSMLVFHEHTEPELVEIRCFDVLPPRFWSLGTVFYVGLVTPSVGLVDCRRIVLLDFHEILFITISKFYL
jgi:hypothetical protein